MGVWNGRDPAQSGGGLKRMAQDYADSAVPDGATVHGLQIAMVITGIGATLPMFTLGTQIASAQGLKLAAGISILACGMVGVLALFTSIAGARCRMSTYQILTFSFGTRGVQLVNFLLAVMLIGWYATVADMLGAAVQQASAAMFGLLWPKWPYTLAALVLMTLTGIFGFHVVERFVRVTVPLLTALMGYVVWLSVSRHGLTPAFAHAGDHSLSSVDALSSVIGAIILTAVLAPDLSRYARNDWNAVLSVLGVVIGFPAMLLLAAIPAAIYGRHDLMDVMTLLQIPGLAIVVLVISTWTSNTCNLYSATLTLATLFRRVSTVHLGVWGALVALVAAVGGIADYFIPLLIGLGIVSAPLAGVYVVDFFVLRERVYDPRTLSELPAIRVTAFVAWLLGSAVGLVETYAGHALTGVPAVDSILIAALGQVLMNSARLRLRLRPRHPPVERS
jgi:cytosine permease